MSDKCVEKREYSAGNMDIRKDVYFLNEQYHQAICKRKVSPALNRALREITPLAPNEPDIRLFSSEQNIYLG